MSECEYDELVACPTCGFVERVEEGDEDRHKQPCPGERCRFALMAVRTEVWDDGDREIDLRWNAGEGPQLYMDDAITALTKVSEFLAAEEAEEERIEAQLDAIRRERQESN